MSLELASFIKDLVATNPQGTDPKSQGDDHLRLIKGVLQSQFSGFTEGVAITKTESQLNAMLAPNQGGLGGALSSALAANIDTLSAVTRYFGIGGSTTGTAPPNGFGSGDMLENLAYDGTRVVQIYYEAANRLAAWIRRWTGSAWTTWQALYDVTPRQSITFQNSWFNASGSGFRRLNGIGYLEGAVSKGAPPTTGQTIFTLPVGYRPAWQQGRAAFLAYNNLASQMADLYVDPATGEVKLGYIVTIGGSPSGTFSMNLTMAFPVAGT